MIEMRLREMGRGYRSEGGKKLGCEKREESMRGEEIEDRECNRVREK